MAHLCIKMCSHVWWPWPLKLTTSNNRWWKTHGTTSTEWNKLLGFSPWRLIFIPFNIFSYYLTSFNDKNDISWIWRQLPTFYRYLTTVYQHLPTSTEIYREVVIWCWKVCQMLLNVSKRRQLSLNGGRMSSVVVKCRQIAKERYWKGWKILSMRKILRLIKFTRATQA